MVMGVMVVVTSWRLRRRRASSGNLVELVRTALKRRRRHGRLVGGRGRLVVRIREELFVILFQTLVEVSFAVRRVLPERLFVVSLRGVLLVLGVAGTGRRREGRGVEAVGAGHGAVVAVRGAAVGGRRCEALVGHRAPAESAATLTARSSSAAAASSIT